MSDENVIVSADIVGDLDKDDCHDMFQIMQNRDEFNYCIFNCLIYLFSEHVNGFFKLHELCSIIRSKTNTFSCEEESIHRSLCITMSLEKFDFIEIKNINKDAYARSTIDAVGFSDCVNRAKKFCKEFEQILFICFDTFKDWIAHSESKKDDS